MGKNFESQKKKQQLVFLAMAQNCDFYRKLLCAQRLQR